MKSIFLLCGALGAVSDASECQSDENSLLQARSLVRHTTTMTTGSQNAADLLRNMRHVANSLLEGSDTTMTADEVNDALDAASDALASLSPVVLQQIETTQRQINDAALAVQVCHDQGAAAQRSSLLQSLSQHSTAVETCLNTLQELRTAEAQQCNHAEDCLCDEARVRTTDQEALCASMTETYEATFCDHHHACTAFYQCHAQEAEVYQLERADVEAEMALIVQEYIAVEQSRCLTGLITQSVTPPRTPISPRALIACDDVDVSALRLDFPALPAEPAACPAHEHGSPPCVARPACHVTIETSSQEHASTGTGAKVEFRVDGEWSQQYTMGPGIALNEAVTASDEFDGEVDAIKVIAAGNDAWGYKRIQLSCSDWTVQLLDSENGQGYGNNQHWVDGNQEAPREQIYEARPTCHVTIETSSQEHASTGAGAKVEFRVNGEWSQQYTMGPNIASNEVVTASDEFDGEPDAIKVIAAGNDAWGYKRIELSCSGHTVQLLDSANGQAYGNNQYWVDGNQEAPIEQIYEA